MPTSGYFNTEPDDRKTIEVKKGSPDKAKYCIFYAVKDDPVIFCRTYAIMKRELKRLHERDDVKQSSIRVFRQVDLV